MISKLGLRKNTRGKICIPILFFYSCCGHLVHHICNIAGFAGTKLRVGFEDFFQGGSSQFAEVILKIENATSHLISVILTKFFQVSTPLDVPYRAHKKPYILKTSKVVKSMTSLL